MPDSFHRLIVKALAFKPIGQVRQFVFDYLLDERPINTTALQTNLEHYKRLEGEAKEAERRISELEEIVREGERIRTEQRTADSHRYMELRADCEAAQTRVRESAEALAQEQARKAGLQLQSETIQKEIQALQQEWERLLYFLYSRHHSKLRQAADARDLVRINQYADALNAEAEDVLSYQVDL